MENQGKCVEYEGYCMKVCDCDKCKNRMDTEMRFGKWFLIWSGILIGALIVGAVVSGVLGIC